MIRVKMIRFVDHIIVVVKTEVEFHDDMLTKKNKSFKLYNMKTKEIKINYINVQKEAVELEYNNRKSKVKNNQMFHLPRE